MMDSRSDDRPGVNLLDLATSVARALPLTPEYAHERAFCWRVLAHAAVKLDDPSLLGEAIERAPTMINRAQTMHAALQLPAMRREIVSRFAEDLSGWERYLYRSEYSDVCIAIATELGARTAADAVRRSRDPFSATIVLCRLADRTHDKVIARALIAEAAGRARTVGVDVDFALGHVVGSLIELGDLAAAEEVVGELDMPELRLSNLERVRRAYENAGQPLDAARVEADTALIHAAQPGVESTEHLLARARGLLEYELPRDGPNRIEGWEELKTAFERGSHAAALEAARRVAPTRFCPESLRLGEDDFWDLFQFQLDAVLATGRNDVKVEFLVDASLAHAEWQRTPPTIPPETTQRIRRVEAPSQRSIFQVDPSTLEDGSALALFLFDRQVATTDEEERWMHREDEDGGETGDARRFVELATELFRGFGALAAHFTMAQIEQGLWWLNSYPFNLWFLLEDEERVPEPVAFACIDSMEAVFRDWVAVTPGAVEVTAIDMWFDQQWRSLRPEFLDKLLEVETRILSIPEDECRYAALHGLNYLPQHPGSGPAVLAFIEENRGQLDPEMLDYAEACATHSRW